MGISKIGLNLLKQAFESGNAVGAEFNVAEAVTFMQKHAKGIGEEIGNHLGGRAKTFNELVTSFGGYDVALKKAEEMAQQFPNAVVKIAGKKSKKGGFNIYRALVKNGDKTVLDEVVSVSEKTGEIKNKSYIAGKCNSRSYADLYKGESHLNVETPLTTIKADGKINDGKLEYVVNIGKEGEIASGNVVVDIAKKGGYKPTSMSYEQADGLTHVKSASPKLDVDIIADTEKAKELVKADMKESAKEIKKLFKSLSNVGNAGGNPPASPLTIQIMRSLRDRLNTAIDLFKYNGRTDFERWLSKDELTKGLADLKKEKVSLEKVKELMARSNVVKVELPRYRAYEQQIKSDISHAEQLVQIMV